MTGIEITLLFVSGLLVGAIAVLFYLLSNLFDSKDQIADFYREQTRAHREEMRQLLDEFIETTKKAQNANESLAKRVVEYDQKFLDLDSKIGMLGMKSWSGPQRV